MYLILPQVHNGWPAIDLNHFLLSPRLPSLCLHVITAVALQVRSMQDLATPEV